MIKRKAKADQKKQKLTPAQQRKVEQLKQMIRKKHPLSDDVEIRC